MELNFYMLPFTKPGHVRGLFEDGVVTSYDSAIRALIERKIDYSKRNVLISHHYIAEIRHQKPVILSRYTYQLEVLTVWI